MTDFSEERLARLISELPPAPAAWVRAAQELPSAKAAIDGLVERAIQHEDERRVILADLEAALRDAHVEPRRELVEELRTRLAGQDGDARP